jgi:pimeloyl-ACP methyl ester carboxylesterase
MTTLAEVMHLGDRARPLDHRREPDPSGPPGLGVVLAELTAGVQVYRLAAARWRLRSAPRAPEEGALVIDVPGWGAPETLTSPLRQYLTGLGYHAQGWGFGRNRGDVQGDVRRLEKHVRELAAARGPVSLVGWSLGGVIVREVARRHPARVRQVVTFGTPLVGGTAYTVGAWFGENADSDRLAAFTEHRDRSRPLQVPVTVILSRRDGVVSWRGCLDRYSPRAQHVEVGSTHLGMVVDPDVWLTIARSLARAGSETSLTA